MPSFSFLHRANAVSDDSLPADPAPAPRREDLDNLPPVTPPSAGFIVQLFLVPAVIVMAIVGVWALFGQIAATRGEWSEHVAELRSNNKHRRDRAMLALAQMIEADRAIGDDGEHLAANPEVARGLVTVFEERLAGKEEVVETKRPKGARPEPAERDSAELERLRAQSTTARALGLLDAVEVVGPALLEGMRSGYDDEVRKDSINSVSVIANRATEEGATSRLNELAATPGLVDELVDVTGESEPLLRDSATYALGLLPTEESRERLAVLAEHRSRETRINAAIGLARQNSKVGLPVFEAVLAAANEIPSAESGPSNRSRSNLLLITLLAATFTSLIMAAANQGTLRYVGVGLSLVLLIGAGVAVARNSPAKRAELAAEAPVDREELRERELDRVLALHELQNSLEATKRLAGELDAPERERFVALVEPIARDHEEPRIRVDATATLRALERVEPATN